MAKPSSARPDEAGGGAFVGFAIMSLRIIFLFSQELTLSVQLPFAGKL